MFVNKLSERHLKLNRILKNKKINIVLKTHMRYLFTFESKITHSRNKLILFK